MWEARQDRAVVSTVQAHTPHNTHFSCHSAVEHNGCMFVFGGYLYPKEKFDSTFAFDLEDRTWEPIQVSGTPPSARYAHTAVLYKKGAEKMDVHIHIIRGESSTSQRASTISDGSYMVVFGGLGNQRFNDVHFFDLDSMEWKLIEARGEIPCARSHHSAVVYGNRYMLVFGGLSDLGNRLNDLHILFNQKKRKEKERKGKVFLNPLK
eukprot:TRINITY_DN1899_c0_g1_i20.p2 TRINITY_DN1899_c0_g1~~TRINITY_DN1899_c0_g1_i20.p2  ORF type:complete len:207 (-),score=31.07 TRINITY_DN1899_c0_g1_i20:1345-1965(-)